MAEVGRPTDLTDELVKKIKQCILEGKNLKETAIDIFNNYTGLSEKEKEKGVDNYIQKIYNWNCDNYLNIGDKIEGWKRDYKLLLADKNIDDILKIGAVPDKVTLKVVADMSKFVKETLDKNNYSKKVETDLTSKGDKITGINYILPNEDGRDNNSTDNQATSSVSGTE